VKVDDKNKRKIQILLFAVDEYIRSAQPITSENQEAQQYGVNGYVQEDSLRWRSGDWG
jgi:hypothetical protein